LSGKMRRKTKELASGPRDEKKLILELGKTEKNRPPDDLERGVRRSKHK